MSDKFKDLEEDFFKAYRSRMKDFMELKKVSDKHETLIMHLGGVIIECYLKHLIVLKYGIKKYRYVKNTSYWFNEESVSLISSKRNSTKDFIRQNSEAKNPGHDLLYAIKSLSELDDLLVDNKEIMEKIKNIQDPLAKNKSTYIDLRYRENQYFKGTDIFDDWMKDFNEVIKWLLNKSQNIEVIR